MRLGNLTHLTRLDVRYNNLSSLPLLASMANLKELLVGFNAIEALGDISAALPPGLALLGARDNKIRTVPDSITHLKQLERIELSNNDISTLPPKMGLLTNLKSIVLEGNPLRSLRRDIVHRGTRAILEHLK